MTKIFNRIRNFSIKEEGAALVEYGIILGLIVVVGAGALVAIGEGTSESLTAAAECVGTDIADDECKGAAAEQAP